MKHLLFGIVLILGALSMSCTKTEIVPVTKIDTVYVVVQPSTLSGSWKMVTTDGVDVSFDIIGNPDNPTGNIYVSNQVVTYAGVSSKPLDISLIVRQPSDGVYLINATTVDRDINGIVLAGILNNLTIKFLPNSSYTQLTGSVYLTLDSYLPTYHYLINQSVTFNKVK